MPTEDDKPYLANKSAAEAVISTLVTVQNQGWLRLHGFCVLPDALQMVMSPIRQGISGVVAHYQAETMVVLGVIVPEALMFWSPSYTSSPVLTQTALNARLEMVRLAPVAAGLVDDAGTYPYSSSNERYKSNVAVYAGFARMIPRDEKALETGEAPRVSEEEA
jgi:hypothetical protein